MKTILIFLLIFFAIRLLMPYILRWVAKAFIKKTMEKGGFTNVVNPFEQAPPQNQPEGNIKVEYVPKTDKQRKDFPGGEYVDYEEVK